jgi:hypothetical protein
MLLDNNLPEALFCILANAHVSREVSVPWNVTMLETAAQSDPFLIAQDPCLLHDLANVDIEAGLHIIDLQQLKRGWSTSRLAGVKDGHAILLNYELTC